MGRFRVLRDEEEQEDRRQVVDGEVDEVAEDVEAADIAVQGEIRVGEGLLDLAFERGCFCSTPDVRPCRQP